MGEPILSIINLHKDYQVAGESHTIINNLNLKVSEKSFICILGHTGCGKSTLLRIICGYEKPSNGEVQIMGQTHIKPTKDVVMVFQDLNQLFPWKTAVENVVYAIHKSSSHIVKKEAVTEAMRLLQEVGLAEYAKYYPHQLSGGMRQCVAVARALAMKPKVLLMDEPFSALDEQNRRKLQKLCRKIYDELDITILFVTHNIEEAISLSDEIFIMNYQDGNIVERLENKCIHDDSKALRDEMRTYIMNVLFAE